MNQTLRRLAVGAVATGSALALTAGPALAFDCIRVSSSPQGLEQSAAHGGNWEVLQVSDLLGMVGVTGDDAACVLDTLAAAGKPLELAIGVGVAGGHAMEMGKPVGGSGILAIQAPEKVVSDGRGIDHLSDSPIVGDIIAAGTQCGVTIVPPPDNH